MRQLLRTTFLYLGVTYCQHVALKEFDLWDLIAPPRSWSQLSHLSLKKEVIRTKGALLSSAKEIKRSRQFKGI